ncbi:E3 SUMO-protein ligase nse2 [Lachnellula suecica]|uniref:E3 SUMO-protein ligase nse2 n=1 Tax=Lachnellula suecica TaxID=602035 RepID=A0A8T9CKA4_9HELO|nr:E3 SUMO-protein ligase nse2 [Lachnellula suecica]
MSSRRHLVSRSRVNNNESSPAPRARQQRDAPDRQPLPPYEPPTCHLRPEAQRALDNLRLNHDYTKYKKHVESAIKALKSSAVSINDQLADRKDLVQRGKETMEKLREAGRDDEDKAADQKEKEEYARHMAKKVGNLTTKAEEALRELIDYGDELAMQQSIITEVSETIANAPVPEPRAAKKRKRRSTQDEGEEENEDNEENASQDDAPADDIEILSAVELWEKSKQDYATQYASKTMRERYDVNEYREFKRIVHDAQHPGQDAPPVPHVRTWFPEDNASQGPQSRRRNNMTDNTRNGSEVDSSDDDVVIERATTNLKCALTLQYFKEPYTNSVCNHTFEKHAIVEYHNNNGSRFGPGPKVVKCPQTGCERMLELKDFYLDELILRKVERAKRLEEQGDDDSSDEDDDIRPRGTQKNRPASINSDDDMDIDADEDQKQRIARVKRERQKSRGLSMAPGGSAEIDEDEV